jgi:putative ABC transport system permease protein
MVRRITAILAAAVVSAGTPALSRTQAAPDMLVSRQLAEREHLSVGDVVDLCRDPACTTSRPFRVAGMYEPVPDPMRFAQERLEARVHLADLQPLIPAGQAVPGTTITAINAKLRDPAQARAFAEAVERRLPGLLARPTNAPDERTSTFTVLDRFHLAIAIVTVIGSGVFLLALMVMLVDERRDTVVTLRLIGLTRTRLLVQVLVEGGLIAVAGALFGVVFAIATEPAFNRFFQWRYDTALVFLRITPSIVARSVLLAIPVGVLASAAAAWAFLRRESLSQVGR